MVGVYMFIHVYMCTYGCRCRFTCNCRCKCKVRCIYRCDYVSVAVEAAVVDGYRQTLAFHVNKLTCAGITFTDCQTHVIHQISTLARAAVASIVVGAHRVWPTQA